METNFKYLFILGIEGSTYKAEMFKLPPALENIENNFISQSKIKKENKVKYNEVM